MIQIRIERPEDVPAIRRVIENAFAGPAEAVAVDCLRENRKHTVSLVAENDVEILGHILFTPVSLDPAHSGFKGVGLAPLSVAPPHQQRGIGSRLVRVGLEACQTAGYSVAVVLGHPEYYPRFGFSRARRFGLQNEYDADEAFMALALEPGALDAVYGTVRYQPEFNTV